MSLIDSLMGKYEKLTIKREKPRVGVDTTITALFNPSEVVYDNQVSWRVDETAMSSKTVANQQTNLQSTQPATLQISLLFDTYEGDPNDTLAAKVKQDLIPRLSPLYFLAWEPAAKPTGVSVKKYTDELTSLTHYDPDLHRPPICTLQWGSWRMFKGVLTSLKRSFTLFLPDGTPVRAIADCTFQEYLTSGTKARELFSPDVNKTYTVRPGDTLINVAAALYNDASSWRVIAKANRIDDPRQITPGQVLRIPPLGPAGER
jgi:nucleoid-associated protein YgaU